MKLSNRTYDCIKFLVTVFLPALSTFIFAISKIWGVPPYAENIVGTISAVCVFLGSLIGISTKQYWKDGELEPPDDGTNG